MSNTNCSRLSVTLKLTSKERDILLYVLGVGLKHLKAEFLYETNFLAKERTAEAIIRRLEENNG